LRNSLNALNPRDAGTLSAVQVSSGVTAEAAVGALSAAADAGGLSAPRLLGAQPARRSAAPSAVMLDTRERVEFVMRLPFGFGGAASRRAAAALSS
jgi:hypothetical protein